MLNLICKICGGELDIDIRREAIVCDYCGGCQPLETDAEIVIDPAKLPAQTIQQYKRAYQAFSSAKTADQYEAAAKMLEQMAGFGESDAMAKEARKKEAQYRKEELYACAVQYLNSQNIDKIQLAAKAFAELGDYRDAKELLKKCPEYSKQLEKEQHDREIEREKIKHDREMEAKKAKHDREIQMKKAQLALEKQEAKEERKRQKLEKRRIRKRNFRIFLVLLIIAGLILGGLYLHSRQHLHITMEPKQDGYYEVKRDQVIFFYEVTVENTGYLDINGFDASVIFENTDGEVLVDTKMYIDNYDTAAVRGKKTVTFTWELSVYDQDRAWELAQTDFEDLKVTIEINEIRFSTGLTRKY